MILRTIIVLVSFLGIAGSAFAQEDVPGSRDHPLLSGYPGSYTAEFEKNYNEVEFIARRDEHGAEERIRVEGDVTILKYFFRDREQ